MKQLSKLVFSLALIAGVSGCIFHSDDKKDNEENTITLPPIGEVYVGDEAYKAIGCGYDIFGNYADPTQIKGRVVEAYHLPDEYTVRTLINHSIYSSQSGNTIQEYQTHLAEGLEISGNYKAFSGAVKMNFTQDYYSLNQTSFTTVMGKINSYQIAIAPNYARVELLRPYMSDQAAKDLDDTNLTAEQIFRMYGTHVITGAVMGARLDFNVAMRSSDIKTGKTINIHAEAEYKFLFGHIDTDASFSSDEERRNYQEHRSLKVNAIGGRSEYAQDILTKSDYDRWINSIAGNEVFCDYTELGLIPVWEFCDSAERKQDLIDHYATWAQNRQIATHDAVPAPQNCILDVHVKDSDHGSSYHSGGLTYYKIDLDLNRGAGGNYIYIYAAVGLDNSTNPKPVTGLALVHGKHASCKDNCPSGYSVIDVDLNKGSGGDFIYLCVQHGNGAPIRRLEVWTRTGGYSRFSNGADSSGAYYDVPVPGESSALDLNRGAGGDFIYLLYSRTN